MRIKVKSKKSKKRKQKCFTIDHKINSKFENKTFLIMATSALRKKLADYIYVADDKKVKAVYALLQDDIEQEPLEYTPELKKKLDEAYAYYKNGGKMISAVEADKQIKKILQSPKRR